MVRQSVLLGCMLGAWLGYEVVIAHSRESAQEYVWVIEDEGPEEIGAVLVQAKMSLVHLQDFAKEAYPVKACVSPARSRVPLSQRLPFIHFIIAACSGHRLTGCEGEHPTS